MFPFRALLVEGIGDDAVIEIALMKMRFTGPILFIHEQ